MSERPSGTATSPLPQANVDELIAQYDEELPQRTLTRRLDLGVSIVCFLISLYVLNQVFFPLRQGNQYYLMWFLAFVLPLVFICYRPGFGRKKEVGERASDAAEEVAASTRSSKPQRSTDNPSVIDWILVVVTFLTCAYPVLPFFSGGFNEFLNRQGSLSTLDVTMGGILLLLILEATRRTTGLILPIFCVVFFLYSYYGAYIPVGWPGAHAGQNFDQIINALYNDASGFYGIPLDVAATYIVLFTIYGAVLDKTGAANFFIDLSFSLFKKSKAAPGRTVALSGFLLGTVSGSGTATAVSLGAVTWPVLKKAGYPKENAGGMLAASGIGAILSPPTLGAAAFIIAELLNVSYGLVLLWAVVPTLLYYLGIFLAIEIDSRKIDVDYRPPPGLRSWPILKKGFYHFISLGIIVVFLALGMAPFKAVVYATLVGIGFGIIEIVLTHRGQPTAILRAIWDVIFGALSTGIRSVLPVTSVCAAAGIIVSTITKTGLGQVISDILVKGAQAISTNPTAVLVFTCIFAAIAVTVLGLAVPVTASFIISWVIVGPALITLGVPEAAAAMFIFYYAVLSEVSPPTALAAVASSAITGGRVIATMWQACKYAIPAFLVPLAFTFTPEGASLVAQGGFLGALWTGAVSACAVAALAAGAGGWIIRRAGWPERVLCFIAAGALLYLQPLSMTIGFAALALAVIVHLVLRRRPRSPRATPAEAAHP
ncbi:TRAP transporter permease [Brevibacterium casei]|uniref:TRAP transporter, 4TM/12TM fusion protein n=2 Tax=Brevibacterium casei TaxID=33889 RepID=A0A2H1JID0_9MICO|nr:TRAP transporter fused permease subunit [Brevibacterium casei]QPR39161.1 TRAP transporter fused permease subunit [Brevibacterium casei]QPR43327.1 TRAP transporter fused permease subunit [Brevibacterium casei]QPS34814.1 TRAP transporter fused permease subunit [Brevibacterium casei]SMX87124.1 TRAP transporter, 4TM/12TM fusion protein [Brevibacterium casei CIP 102111]